MFIPAYALPPPDTPPLEIEEFEDNDPDIEVIPGAYPEQSVIPPEVDIELLFTVDPPQADPDAPVVPEPVPEPEIFKALIPLFPPIEGIPGISIPPPDKDALPPIDSQQHIALFWEGDVHELWSFPVQL